MTDNSVTTSSVQASHETPQRERWGWKLGPRAELRPRNRRNYPPKKHSTECSTTKQSADISHSSSCRGYPLHQSYLQGVTTPRFHYYNFIPKRHTYVFHTKWCGHGSPWEGTRLSVMWRIQRKYLGFTSYISIVLGWRLLFDTKVMLLEMTRHTTRKQHAQHNVRELRTVQTWSSHQNIQMWYNSRDRINWLLHVQRNICYGAV